MCIIIQTRSHSLCPCHIHAPTCLISPSTLVAVPKQIVPRSVSLSRAGGGVTYYHYNLLLPLLLFLFLLLFLLLLLLLIIKVLFFLKLTVFQNLHQALYRHNICFVWPPYEIIYDYPHFTNERNEAGRNYITYPRSYCEW